MCKQLEDEGVSENKMEKFVTENETTQQENYDCETLLQEIGQFKEDVKQLPVTVIVLNCLVECSGHETCLTEEIHSHENSLKVQEASTSPAFDTVKEEQELNSDYEEMFHSGLQDDLEFRNTLRGR